MRLEEAQKILSDILAPCGYDQFFDEYVGKKPLTVIGKNTADRHLMLGEDPKDTILSAYETYAPFLTSHNRTPKGPPPSAKPVQDADAFLQLIKGYHKGGYTVRIPDVLNLSPRLTELTRAIEVIIGNPAGVVVFWSDSEAEAPIHHDEIDVIVLQLVGSKKWFISDEPPTQPNIWKSVGEGVPPFERYSTIDIAPGDLLYVPRGTPHTVKSTSESIHLAIGFTPVTVREMIAAALDQLSELNQPLRADLGTRADCMTQNKGADIVLRQIRDGIAQLQENAQSNSFVRDAIVLRKARMLEGLPKLPRPDRIPAVALDSRVRHHPLAYGQLNALPHTLEFRQPGEQFLIHLGAEEAMRFILDTNEFTIADIPGAIDDSVRIALVNRLLKSGFLIEAG